MEDNLARRLVEQAAAEAAAWGMNLAGVIDAEAYDSGAPAGHRLRDAWPAAGSALILGSAGPLFWERFLARRAREPALARLDDPLDAHTVDVVAPIVTLFREQGVAARAVFPFYGAQDHALSFRCLSFRAGFGADSVLGLILHPEYGPWNAARAAVLTAASLPPSMPLSAFRPCVGCPAPCVAACPGDAFPDGRWSDTICLEAKRQIEPCRTSCLARIHCVIGAAHRYPEDEMAYHCASPEARKLPDLTSGDAVDDPR